MEINYDSKTDLLYIRIDKRKNKVVNKRITEVIVLDLGENDIIVGIEIMDASKHLHLEDLLPVKFKMPA